MRSFKVLLFAVVLPGMLSLAFFGAMRGGDDHHRDVRVVHAVHVDVDEIEAAAREVEVVVRRLEGSRDGQCTVSRSESLRLAADEVRSVRIEAGSGELTVHGTPDADEIVVVARMCASSRELLDGLSASLERDGSVAELGTEYPSSRSLRRATAKIDLEVRVPEGMAAEIEDGSGALLIEGTGDTRIADASGDIVVRELLGGVTIRDSSGSIRVAGVQGDVDVVDGSGDVSLEEIVGSIRMTDGSGGLDMRGVGGDIWVRADGSGDIEVADVAGDFRVDADGSGSITHADVDGEVRVPRKR